MEFFRSVESSFLCTIFVDVSLGGVVKNLRWHVTSNASSADSWSQCFAAPLCIVIRAMSISYVDCSNTFAWPLEQAAEGNLWGVGQRSCPSGEVWRGGLPLPPPGKLSPRKNFQNLLKNSAVWTTFCLSLRCSNTFARKCMWNVAFMTSSFVL